MTHFPDERRLEAYHDGELSAAERAEVELTLDDSPSGMQYLAELARMSAWLATEAGASAARLSPMSRARLHKRVDTMIEPLLLEERLVRFGWELSGVAAAVLLVGSAWLMSAAANPGVASANTGPATVPPWVGAQVAAVADPVAQQQQPATPAAAWYLADGTPRD
jgi:anti-sigma factor RsiW